METTKFTFEQDWDNDGMIRYSNAKTLKRYKELNEQRNSCDLTSFDMFCAFSNEQFENGSKTIRPLREGEKYVTLGAGVYGTKDGVKRYLDFAADIRRRIAEECDPQEVYCYEFNNFESCIAYDGDVNAIRHIIDVFGAETANSIKRFCAFYSIEHLLTDDR